MCQSKLLLKIITFFIFTPEEDSQSIVLFTVISTIGDILIYSSCDYDYTVLISTNR
ncbi:MULTISPECIES: DUF3938 domain-containing protein [Lactobacillus]|uniref:DUF3938 domain-containing protein n=1 Tax=Lactobacillus TaxID=1578 RepID=UPI000DE35F32|nr:DUF3938 domain-containing protein [Lactobacillus sp. JM1]QTP20835.1 DUF3938 domain-containing protein [Lactobacillus gasseri]